MCKPWFSIHKINTFLTLVQKLPMFLHLGCQVCCSLTRIWRRQQTKPMWTQELWMHIIEINIYNDMDIEWVNSTSPSPSALWVQPTFLLWVLIASHVTQRKAPQKIQATRTCSKSKTFKISWMNPEGQSGGVKAVCVRFSSRLGVLGAGEAWMSVSLITGIGEKVRPSRLTTPTLPSLCVLIPLCVCNFHILICVRRCVCLCVCGGEVGVGRARGRNWFSAEGEEMRRKRKMAEGREVWEEQEERKKGRGGRGWRRGWKGLKLVWKMRRGVNEVELRWRKWREEMEEVDKGARGRSWDGDGKDWGRGEDRE